MNTLNQQLRKYTYIVPLQLTGHTYYIYIYIWGGGIYASLLKTFVSPEGRSPAHPTKSICILLLYAPIAQLYPIHTFTATQCNCRRQTA